MKTDWKQRIVFFIYSFMLFVVLLFTAVEWVVFNPIYFSWHYSTYAIMEDVGVPKSQLMDVTDRMLKYLKSEAPDLNYEVTIDGKTQEFFDDTDKAHMVDVKKLFEWGFFLRNLFLMIIVFTFATLYLKNPLPIMTYGQRFLRNMAGILGVFGILAGYTALDFNRAFVLFHKLLFTNDLWLLDPDVSRLINIVPEQFFMNTALLIVILFILLIVACYMGFRPLEKTSLYREGE